MAHEHEHEHEHAQSDLDWAELADHLESQAEVFTPLYERAMAWLTGKQTEPGLVVDAGSGPGVLSGLLAEAFPGARVVAVDSSAPLLERARARADRQGHGDRFDTLTGELPSVLDALEYPADLIWASRSLHHLGDQRAAIAGLAARLAPGGTLALVEGGLPSRFLPRDIGIGRPGLQARIDVIEEARFARMRAELPGSVPETEDWAALMRAAGLRPTGSRTFLLDLPAPLPDRVRTHIAAVLTRTRENFATDLDTDDLTTLTRLTDPNDKASVHHRPDVFTLSAHTLHTAARGL
ncbi:class I SAM-dependent methyltransferase [Streptomyces sp. NPDC087212]|uniref:class I SAM-dependent methyltransferase n=1 Tax=Streptomyces sp. NPDC087212 TaxID=3365766 RepID=UPI003827F688